MGASTGSKTAQRGDAAPQGPKQGELLSDLVVPSLSGRIEAHTLLREADSFDALMAKALNGAQKWNEPRAPMGKIAVVATFLEAIVVDRENANFSQPCYFLNLLRTQDPASFQAVERSLPLISLAADLSVETPAARDACLRAANEYLQKVKQGDVQPSEYELTLCKIAFKVISRETEFVQLLNEMSDKSVLSAAGIDPKIAQYVGAIHAGREKPDRPQIVRRGEVGIFSPLTGDATKGLTSSSKA